MIFVYIVLAFVIGVIVGKLSQTSQYSAGYLHGKEDAERFYNELMERKRVNGIYEIKEEV